MVFSAQLMKDFPLNELLRNRPRQNPRLPRPNLQPHKSQIQTPPVDVISRDQLLRVLTSHRLPYTSYETFDRLLSQSTNIFRTWDDLIQGVHQCSVGGDAEEAGEVHS